MRKIVKDFLNSKEYEPGYIKYRLKDRRIIYLRYTKNYEKMHEIYKNYQSTLDDTDINAYDWKLIMKDNKLYITDIAYRFGDKYWPVIEYTLNIKPESLILIKDI